MRGDTAAAEAHGITKRTVRLWRDKLRSDVELAGLYADELASADGRWRDELRDVATEAARALLKLQRRHTQLVLALAESPQEHLNAMGEVPDTEAILRVMGRAMDDARATLERTSEVLVHYEALVGVTSREHTREDR
jgi:hypothetical protein